MKTCEPRELRKIASISKKQYTLIGFYLTGSDKTFGSVTEALKYAHSKNWKVLDPLKLKHAHKTQKELNK